MGSSMPEMWTGPTTSTRRNKFEKDLRPFCACVPPSHACQLSHFHLLVFKRHVTDTKSSLNIVAIFVLDFIQ